MWNPKSGTSVWRPQSRYTMSRIECRIKFPQNQRCRAKIALHPPKSRCRTFLRTPLSHFPLIRSRQGAKGGARRAGGGYRGTFGFRKRIALQGGIAATVTPVALLSLERRSGSNKKEPSILNLSLENPHGTPTGTMFLIEKIPLGEFDLLEATLEHRVTGNVYITAIIFPRIIEDVQRGWA